MTNEYFCLLRLKAFPTVASLLQLHPSRVGVLCTGLKMVCQCWLLVAVMAFVCIPGFESVCWDNSICKDLSNKARILVGQTALPLLLDRHHWPRKLIGALCCTFSSHP